MNRLLYSPAIAAGAACFVLTSSATALAYWVVRADAGYVTLAAAELPAGGRPVGTLDGQSGTLRWRGPPPRPHPPGDRVRANPDGARGPRTGGWGGRPG